MSYEDIYFTFARKWKRLMDRLKMCKRYWTIHFLSFYGKELTSSANFSSKYCFFCSLCTSKFKKVQFTDIVSSAIPLFPEEETDWVEFQSKKEKN